MHEKPLLFTTVVQKPNQGTMQGMGCNHSLLDFSPPVGGYPVHTTYHTYKSDICQKLWKLIYPQYTLWQITKV